ncbi:uncharacterized protein LOC144617117 [Panthera onca]
MLRTHQMLRGDSHMMDEEAQMERVFQLSPGLADLPSESICVNDLRQDQWKSQPANPQNSPLKRREKKVWLYKEKERRGNGSFLKPEIREKSVAQMEGLKASNECQ